ncbi:MAG TPA: Stf0 family sulfotransferase [Gammaproteobacteria bacterium]|nr:Stf0 family sulfotransferase [Gammaproteobacteria bacterium]
MTLIPNTPKSTINLIDAEYDFPSPATPTTFYAVATYARTGSYLLCEKLWRTGQMGAPFEYFNHFNLMLQMVSRLGADSIQDYVNSLFNLRTSPNGVFGMKLFPEHFQFMHLARIVWLFPNLQFIYLEREDLLAQAVSYAKAMQTSQWTNLDLSQGEPRYDYNLLLTCIRRIEQAKKFWDGYFKNNRIEPVRLTYEKLTNDTGTVIDNILDHFNVVPDKSFTIELPEIRKQTDKTNAEWKKQLQGDLGRFNPKILKRYSV